MQHEKLFIQNIANRFLFMAIAYQEVIIKLISNRIKLILSLVSIRFFRQILIYQANFKTAFELQYYVFKFIFLYCIFDELCSSDSIGVNLYRNEVFRVDTSRKQFHSNLFRVQDRFRIENKNNVKKQVQIALRQVLNYKVWKNNIKTKAFS